MPDALEQVMKDALDLSPSQRLALAEILLGSTEVAHDPTAEATWENEIRERILAIDEGRVSGIACEDMMQAAEKLLSR